ncbi:short-chain dehydrogenase/reductase family [Colletotrichum tofieldiae]|uniref:Short-chain dehydrogenase/reductase family n=1 Tax=Colletotrichum tofieldiae TaxID=708197 RepID=A0A166QIH8_9PEZI|nr:short-chain dehydrogenase/reductase family [Colletotrichum tofieldiae]GKT58658.1 short-chain dehydrogenase/reductase family [Colletotrichum tofieldiae]GKT77922.1 short-chain dehydrogenase/reductase family [Colletotrichum tofieldiae]GKT84768.1 short-chain dehydrogenase/reductase family [Colletotrichum tofieldiae]
MRAVDFIRSQFKKLPYPSEDCAGRTVIVTGSNVGLGLEAARHFVRLNAAKVILAVRSTDKGEAAKTDIELTTGRRDVIEVWPLDQASFDSVKEFAARADKLPRLDCVVLNASIATGKRADAEGWESQVTVNVLSTFLLSLKLLPVLRRTGKTHNVTPKIVIVSSDASQMAKFHERNAEDIYKALNTNKSLSDRYNTTKLMQIILARQMAIAADASGKGRVQVTTLNPGLCATALFRNVPFPLTIVVKFGLKLLARSAEVGSRCLMAGAFAGEEAHGRYMSDCVVTTFPKVMQGEEGEQMQGRLWEETVELLNGVDPGVSMNL